MESKPNRYFSACRQVRRFSTSRPPRSGNIADGPRTYSFTFTTAGVYHYHCENHGQAGGIGMAGTVTVNSPAP